MYIMDIKIFGYKINLEILILIGVIYLILVGHTFCGCCNFGLMEGFDTKEDKKKHKVRFNLDTQNAAGTNPAVPTNTSSVSTTTSKEGFTGANINYGESSLYDLNDDQPMNTSSWSQPDLTITPGQPLSPAVQKFMERKSQLPLPEGEMFMFANAEFKPECCPGTYSNSSGCACLSLHDTTALKFRGGNNQPYSEY
jgi:hypothetical protein